MPSPGKAVRLPPLRAKAPGSRTIQRDTGDHAESSQDPSVMEGPGVVLERLGHEAL